MKIKTTIILFIVFVALLIFIYFFEFKGKKEVSEFDKLVDLSAEDVQKISLKREGETLAFQRDGDEWIIIEPIEARADKYEVNRLAEDFSRLRIERIVEEDAADSEKYGIPEKEITLYLKENERPVRILVGSENPLDNTYFAKKEGETRIVLIPSSLKNLLEKSLFDFRLKNVFQFEADDVFSIKLKAKEIQWNARRKEEEWFLEKPVKALAESSKINDILYALSNMRAEEFVSEDKKEGEVTRYGLDIPEYEIVLEMPLESREITFFLHKEEDKLYSTTSLSPKIIAVEDSVLSDLEKKVEDLREKEIADFFTWETNKIRLKKRDIDWILVKDEEDNWHFESPVKEEADKEKIDSFIREIESLEASEFIDPPLVLKEHGLDQPQAEVKIWVGEDEEKKEISILIGTTNEETKKVVVKNARLDYLFRVDSAFLDEFPKDLRDWKKAEEKQENKQE